MAKCTKGSEDIIDMTTENGGNSVELSISKEKKEKVSELLDEMSKLTNLEKIYMHLKLPPCPIIENEIKSDSPPSGSAAYRISTALNWIQSHYVEDRRVCLPKQDVYSHYKLYCDTNGINPMAIADFGKVMKTAFPSVYDRRLGQRGKSKYFYGGLRRKSSVVDSSDPDSNKMEDTQLLEHGEELEILSSQLVCEWASCLLGKNFSSVKSLAHYLVFSGASCGKKAALFNMLLDMDSWETCTAHDTQALLQRKIHQKEVLKEHKSLLKQQETNQKDTQAAHPTAARLAVLSPSLHALHSTDASNSHVLNVARNNSASSTPILPVRQESSERYTSILESDKSKLCSNPNKALDINKNIPISDIEPHIDKTTVKSKQSKLVSSKSLEDSNQRQPKRNGDFLHNTNQEGKSKRRRCITSLGMAGLVEQSSESIEQNNEDQKEGTIMRPVSCPVFNGDLQTFICDMESEDIETTSTAQIPETTKSTKEIDSVPDINISSDNEDKTSKFESPSSSSFHFVRKPTVISVKPPELNENNDPLCSNVSDNICDNNNGHVSPEKKSHRIMNAILSSSDSNIPHHFSSRTEKMSSLVQPSCGASQMTDSLCDSNKDNDKNFRREAHTLDNAYLLPCQSSRSAFVRVMNGKGHKRSEIVPRPRHSSFDGSLDSEHSKQNHNRDKPEVNAELLESKTALEIPSSLYQFSSAVVNHDTKQCPDDNFKSIAISSSNDRVPSTVLGISKDDRTEITTPVSSSSGEIASVNSCTTEPLQSLYVHLTSPTMTSPIQSKTITKSPVTPPKRHQSRSRFTPIRPKISGCCNLSPQKKDMRPIATILKEQRARSAQELLVNLASSYQGGLKVQLPSDLFGLSGDKATNPISSVMGSLANQNVPRPTAVILEPVSLSNPITTQASPMISSQKILSVTSDVATIPSVSSTLSGLLAGPKVSETANVSTPTNYQSLTPSSTIVSTHSIPIQSIESPIIVTDAKGMMYSLGTDAGKPSPKVSSLQQLLQGGTHKIKPPSSTPQQNLMDATNVKGHILGPDACGQTFLLVPNSESATLPPNHNLIKTSNANLMSLLSSPKQRHSPISRSTPISGVSSSALLSELSQLASVSNTKQPVIKHDSTVSAFQKCEPNKSIIDTNSDDRTEVKTETGNQKGEMASLLPLRKENTSDHGVMSCDEMSDNQEIGNDVCLRKRKASKGQDDKCNEKKRHNTESDDMVFVESDDQSVKTKERKEVIGQDIPLTPKDTGESGLQMSNDETDVTDTEALLNLIDSRSMTVKQTVMAMNSLKAQMIKSNLSLPAKTGEDDSTVKDDWMENAVHDTRVSEKSTQRTLHVIRRNTSLNLESLESDALLDTELYLDHHLVEDIKHCKNGKSDLKTSVAVAAKSHRSRSSDRKKESMRKSKDHTQVPTISPKALHSYQMILNEKNKSHKDKESDKVITTLTTKQAKESSQKEDINVSEQNPQRRLQRRCVSSMQDILQGGSKPLPPAFGHQNAKSQSEVDVFDALLSRMYSKQLVTNQGNATRSHSALVQDSELPVDIVDFVTESMSSRRDSLERNPDVLKIKNGKHTSKSFKPQESIVARSISVPNTKPDFIDAEQAHANLTCSRLPNTSFRMEPSQLFLQPAVGDNMSFTEENGPSTAKNVFLSPVGPAKLARRSSVEKSIAQGQMDRSVARVPVELSSSPSASLPSLKEKLTTDACNSSNSERHNRTKTPVDRALLGSSEKHRSQTPIMQLAEKGYKSPVNRTLTKTPIEKCFVKQSSDPLPPRSDLMLPILSSVRREDASSVQTFVSDGGYSSGSVSQTPNSDYGRSSVSQTPISDFGYSSVSPSPVMMSSTAYVGECGRNLSPATIFMPLRSDSALSMNNNNPRSESPSASQYNRIEHLTRFSNHSQSDNTSTNGSNNTLTRKDGHSSPQFTSELSRHPSLLDTLSSKALFSDEKEENKVIKTCSDTKTLLKLLTSSLQSIPTPPVSPSNSPPNTLPLPFSIPSPRLPCSGTSPLNLPFSTAPCFVPPMSSSSLSSSVHMRQIGCSPHFRSHDLPSPALPTHSYTPSPQILTRPPSSPHQYSSHPSPPFTPCSLRSLPSPRCMTPLSHKSLISPRSVTPSSDSSQAAPNRFMPIQSSGVLSTSQTSTHTYIQPIKPVVALASASSSHNSISNNNNAGVMSTSSHLSNSGLTHSLQSVPPLSSPSNSLSQSLGQGMDSSDIIRTSEHKPLEANSTLILSLSGDIRPLSHQGVNLTWRNTELSRQQQRDITKQISMSGKPLDVMHQSKNGSNKVSRSQNSQQSLVIQSQLLSPSSHSLPHQSKPRENSSSAIVRLPTAQPNSNLPNDCSRSLINTSSSSSRAFKPPPSLSSPSPSSVRSFKPVSVSLMANHQLDCSNSQSQPHGRVVQVPQNSQIGVDRIVNRNSTGHRHQESDSPWVSNTNDNNHQTLQNLLTTGSNLGAGGATGFNPATHDELQATLDVLKDMDSQYFL